MCTTSSADNHHPIQLISLTKKAPASPWSFLKNLTLDVGQLEGIEAPLVEILGDDAARSKNYVLT
ncbi:hypothetical protein [Dyella psychrodurans]|uniref:hypothetical protein n=1 Tax=Dyella psychrodurans TaxID=1927960 RepID=UPI0011C0233B|nr:hypothetical protein [Dyella psychrodurans]